MPIPINSQQPGVMCREIGDFVQAKQERILQVIKAAGEIGLGYVGRRTFQNSKTALKAHRTGLEVLLHHLTTRPRTDSPSLSFFNVYNKVSNAYIMCYGRHVIV